MATKKPDKRQQCIGFIKNSEEINSTECLIKGCVPTWLSGDVVRNGPGEFDIGPDTFDHWFDGHAILHRYSIANGKVVYNSKFLKSKTYQKNHEHSRIVMGEFATASRPDPCKNIFQRVATKFTQSKPESDNANVNIAKLGESVYAITDAAIAHRFDPESLETKKSVMGCGSIEMTVTTAHPHYDLNGDYLNVGSTFGRQSFYHIIKVPVSKMNSPDPMNEMEVFMKFEVNDTNPSYHHSFGITENWIIFHEQPLSYSIPRVLVGQFLWRGILSSFYQDNSKKSVFHVINKTTGLKLKTKYSAKGMFCFHHINAYETRGEDGNTFLVVDMCCSDQSPLWLFNTDNLRAEGKEIENWNFNLDRKKLVRPRRYVIPLDIPSDASQGSNLVTIRGCKATAILCVDGSVSLEHELLIPDDIAGTNAAIELPRINYDYYNGRKYNYMYGVQGANFLPDQLVKINVEKKELLEWGETDKFPSEPVFVPRPDATEEDDGIILSTVISKCPEDKTFLLILDASTFKEIARAEVDAKLSYPLHGNFYEHA